MAQTTAELSSKKCQACEGMVASYTPDEALSQMKLIGPEWQISSDHKKISAEFNTGNFRSGLAFVNKVGELAEDEGHHPIVTLKFRSVVIDLWTHAVDGLTENDFILAAKIDQIDL